MSVFNGRKITVEINGESHSPFMSLLATGFPEFNLDERKITEFMQRRSPSSEFSTSRKEKDRPVFDGDKIINDGKISAKIFNENVRSNDYDDLYGKPRPSHADYCAYLKDGTLDYKGGGRFSGRLTAMLCLAGAIALQYLEKEGIRIYSFVSEIDGITGKSFSDGVTEEELKSANARPPFSITNGEKMLGAIREAHKDGDSVGGVAEVVILGMKKGIGDNLFEGLDGKISQLIFGVPAVKGISFGEGFSLAGMRGSVANDQMIFKDGKAQFLSNRSGGINGGISNGAPIYFKTVIKPTPTIFKEQSTVDLVNKKTTTIKPHGRHDSCILLRALPCLESATALAILDELL